MNPFDEMVLLPKESYNKLTSQALHGSMPSLQKELEQLHANHSNLPDDQKNKLEQEIIAKYTNHCKSSISQEQQQLRQPSTAQTDLQGAEEEDDDDELILRHLKNFRKNNNWRAQQLYSHLKSTVKPRRWNNNGQMIDEESGEPIPRSNIVDLIHYATSTITPKNKSIPPGVHVFINLLRDTNAPQTFISTNGALRLIKILENKVVQVKEEKEKEPEVNKRPVTRAYKRQRTDDGEDVENTTWDSLK